MSNNLLEWKNKKLDDPSWNKDINKKSDEDLLKLFALSLSFSDSTFEGIRGFGPGKINELTIATFGKAFVDFISVTVKDPTKRGVMISFSNFEENEKYIKILSQVLRMHGVKCYMIAENKSINSPITSFIVQRLKFAGALFFDHNVRTKNQRIEIFDSNGTPFNDVNMKELNKKFDSYDMFDIPMTDTKLSYINPEILNEYIFRVSKLSVRPNDQKKLKIIYSPLHGSNSDISTKIIEKNNYEYYKYNKHFKESYKDISLESGAAYGGAVRIASRKNLDIVICNNKAGKSIGIVAKYKKRFKYINNNQLTALYLNYLITNMKANKKFTKNSFIVKSFNASNLAAKIAEANNIEVFEAESNFASVTKKVMDNENKKQFIMAYSENGNWIIDNKMGRVADGNQMLQATMEMANYYKTQNSNLYTELKKLYKKIMPVRTSNRTYNSSNVKLENIFSYFKNAKSLGDKKIVSNEIVENKMIKIILDDGSWFTYKLLNNKAKIIVETKGTKKDDTYLKIISEEKKIWTMLEDIITNEKPLFNKKRIFKFSMYSIILMIIMYFVFGQIYSYNDVTPFMTTLKGIISSVPAYMWFLLISWSGVIFMISFWSKLRIFRIQKDKIKKRYLLNATIMSSLSSIFSPFAAGSELLGYWYLKRKGVKRSILISNYITSLIIYQLAILIQFIVLLAMGGPIYSQLMSKHRLLMTFFIIGVSINIFSIFMTYTLAMNKNIQDKIVKSILRLLEWLPFIYIYDSAKYSATIRHELGEIRKSLKNLINKKSILLELIIYSLIPFFFNPLFFIFADANLVAAGLSRGEYVSQLVTSHFVTTANSFIPTLGGLGTYEWIYIGSHDIIFNGSEFAVNNNLSAKEISSHADFINKVFLRWPILLVSTISWIVAVKKFSNNKRKSIVS